MFRTAKELKLLFYIVDLDHVFERLAEENDPSDVNDVAGFIFSTSQAVIMFGIIVFCLAYFFYFLINIVETDHIL